MAESSCSQDRPGRTGRAVVAEILLGAIDRDDGEVAEYDEKRPPLRNPTETECRSGKRHASRKREWTHFELQAVLALLCRRVHLQKGGPLTFATMLNEALNGKNKVDNDVSVADVRALLEWIFREKKAAVAFIEQQVAHKITRRASYVFARNIPFDGSEKEWLVDGRKITEEWARLKKQGFDPNDLPGSDAHPPDQPADVVAQTIHADGSFANEYEAWVPELPASITFGATPRRAGTPGMTWQNAIVGGWDSVETRQPRTLIASRLGSQQSPAGEPDSGPAQIGGLGNSGTPTYPENYMQPATSDRRAKHRD